MKRTAPITMLALGLILAVTGSLRAQGTSLGTVHLTPGWATFGHVVPEGLAVDGLKVGNLTTQTDVKNRWPDGSIRFAVLTVEAGAEGDYVITAGSASAAVSSPPGPVPDASVAFSLYSDPAIQIKNISIANPTRVTTPTPHGLTTGDVIFVSQSMSNPSLNGPRTVTVVDLLHFTIPVDASGFVVPADCQPSVATRCPYHFGRFVRLNATKVGYLATLPAVQDSDAWLSGPLVYEARSVVAPVSLADGSAHPFLRVIFDTRVYPDRSRVDVTVENVLNKTGATTVWYDVSVSVDGRTEFTHPVADLPVAPVEHFYLTRWRQTFATGALASVKPDLAPFHLARAVPPFLPIVANIVEAPTGPEFDILREGALNRNMPAHSGRAELAPFPDWTARYLVYRDPVQRSFVLAHGDLSGSFPVHVREPENALASVRGVGSEQFVSLNQRPTLWFDARAADEGIDFIRGGPLPMREYGTVEPGPGQSALIPDNAHQPSLAYIPYLLTGDRYYAEEMAFWANYAMLRTSNGDGSRGVGGILANQETRGYAWALRNLVDAAAYYPEASPVQDYLSAKVTANLDWLDAFANAQDPVTNPFKLLWLGFRPNEPGYIAMWEQNYLAYAIDRAVKQGFAGGVAHRDAIAKLQLLLFTSQPAYPRTTTLTETTYLHAYGQDAPAGTVLTWGAPFLVGVATVLPGGRWGDPAYHTIFTTREQIAAATVDPANYRPYAGFYGPEARLNLMVGIEGQWPGAQSAYDHLFPFIGIQEYRNGVPDLADRPGWALDFYPIDTDRDGIADPADLDDDGDGTPDATDPFPGDATETLDTDGDGTGNNADADDDNDGQTDADEVASGSNPLNASSKAADLDGDNRPDAVDPDDDNDSVLDASDAFPRNASETTDTDSDGTGNNADTDDDGDGQTDADEVGSGSDPLNASSKAADLDGDTRPDAVDPDDDNDGALDGADAFPRNASETTDTDADGTGNNADTDDDGDAQTDADEVASGSDPLNASSKAADFDGDTRPDAVDPDDDNDGVLDGADAFPKDASETVDTDGDGTGNNADTDDDNDGQTDADEVASGSNPLDASSKAADFDGDTRPDAVDPDDDNDGALDAADAFPTDPSEAVDTDGDGTGNNADTDDDGDGQTDADEAASGSDPLDASSKAADFDGDTRPDAVDPDDDNDGALDAADAFPKDASETIDTDGDGIGNNADTDDDSDETPDATDAFPLDASESRDTDLDGIGNNADLDDDADGTPDAADAFPLNASETVDTDLDGTGDNADLDDDGDGMPDATDAFPLDAAETRDTDLDGIGNNADLDDDGDGTPDAADAFPLNATETTDTDGDGLGNNADLDDDGDGTADAADAFPLDGAETADTDRDGLGNNADLDDDDDGAPDATDAFPLNPAETTDTDRDGTGNNADLDDDGDDTLDVTDAFPLNAGETTDTDLDGTGNNADADDDGDGVPDAADAFPLNPNERVDTDGDGAGDNADLDDDGDGAPDATDAFPLNASEHVDTDGDGIGNNADLDDDGDGTPDAADAFALNPGETTDTDGDSLGNNADPDDDGDGSPDAADAFPLNASETTDTDRDGMGNNADPDDDGDGTPDAADDFPLNPTERLDTDGDGTGNNADQDDDGDGVTDVADVFPLNASETSDLDRDGLGNNADQDDDGDGVPDASDAFPLTATEAIDTDRDGLGNNADQDDDGDGVPDATDASPLTPNAPEPDGDSAAAGLVTDSGGGAGTGTGTSAGTSAGTSTGASTDTVSGTGTGTGAMLGAPSPFGSQGVGAFPGTVTGASPKAGTTNPTAGPGSYLPQENLANPEINPSPESGEAIDTDGDGTADNDDVDDDNDGRVDSSDPFPLVANRAPTATSPGPQASVAKTAIESLQLAASDRDGDTLTYSAVGLPLGLSLDPGGLLSGIPSVSAAEKSDVTVTVSDGLVETAITFPWTVINTIVGSDVAVSTPAWSVTFSTVSAPGSTLVAPKANPIGSDVPPGFVDTGAVAYDITSSARFSGPLVVCFDVSALVTDAATVETVRILNREGSTLVDRTILAAERPAAQLTGKMVCAAGTSFSSVLIARKLVP